MSVPREKICIYIRYNILQYTIADKNKIKSRFHLFYFIAQGQTVLLGVCVNTTSALSVLMASNYCAQWRWEGCPGRGVASVSAGFYPVVLIVAQLLTYTPLRVNM